MNSKHKRQLSAGFLQKAENIMIAGNSSAIEPLANIRKALKHDVSEKEITEAIDKLTQILQDPKGNMKPKHILQVQNYLTTAKSILNDKSSGKIQEMLNIYKQIAPEDYENIVKALNTAVKSLDDSINIESIQYFDKIRDLKIGSAPTDALSVVGSGAYIAYGLSGTKDKDEKISIMLKEGIPVLGTVGTSLFCMARLVSGSKSLIVGLISGAIIGAIGKYADELRKKYLPVNKQPLQNTQTSQTTVKGV